jgi:ubiquinone/menaquinone biosynthesis C-methylase UbiE
MRTARGLIRYLEEVANDPDEQIANQRSEISAAQSQAIEDNVVTCLKPKAGDRILELGCGTGMIARALFAHANRVVVVDVAYNMLVRAKTMTPGLPAVKATSTALPFRDNSFDKVSFNGVIPYLSADDVMATLGELRRIVRSEGTIFIGDICDPERESDLLTKYERIRGWRLRARLATSRAKEIVRPLVGLVWRSRRRRRGWYSQSEFLDCLSGLEMRGRVREQGPGLPYHDWRYDCLVRVEKP